MFLAVFQDYRSMRGKYFLSWVCILALSLVLGGCTALTPSQSKPVAKKPISPELQNKLYDLEDRAVLAINNNHLAYPVDGSAVNLLEQMLRLDPGNEAATRGLEQVVEQYIALALAAANERLFAKARSMLARAKLVDANHPSLAPTMTQINLLEKAKRKIINLSTQQLFAASGERKIASLVRAGNANCRYTIAAINDKQGRWIYKVLKDAASNNRPKAKIIISSPIRIEQICLTNPE